MIFPYVRHHVDESSAIPSGEIARPEILMRIIEQVPKRVPLIRQLESDSWLASALR
jgi:hypothetical protein